MSSFGGILCVMPSSHGSAGATFSFWPRMLPEAHGFSIHRRIFQWFSEIDLIRSISYLKTGIIGYGSAQCSSLFIAIEKYRDYATRGSCRDALKSFGIQHFYIAMLHKHRALLSQSVAVAKSKNTLIHLETIGRARTRGRSCL